MELSPLEQITSDLSTELDSRSLSVPTTIVPSGLLSPTSAQILYAFIHFSYTGAYAVPPNTLVKRRSLVASMETCIDVLSAAAAARNQGLVTVAQAEFTSLRARLKDRDVLDILSMKHGAHPTVDAELRSLVEDYHNSPARAKTLQSWVTLANAPSLCATVSGAYLDSRSELIAVTAREAAATQQAAQIRAELDEERRLGVQLGVQLTQLEARIKELELEREEERMKLMVEDMHRASEERASVEHKIHGDSQATYNDAAELEIRPSDVDTDSESDYGPDPTETTSPYCEEDGEESTEVHTIAGIHEMDGEPAATATTNTDVYDHGLPVAAVTAPVAMNSPSKSSAPPEAVAAAVAAMAAAASTASPPANNNQNATTGAPPGPQHAFQDFALEPAATDESDLEDISVHPPTQLMAPKAQAEAQDEAEDTKTSINAQPTGEHETSHHGPESDSADVVPPISNSIVDAVVIEPQTANLDASSSVNEETATSPPCSGRPETDVPSNNPGRCVSPEAERPALPPRPDNSASVATAAVSAAVTAAATASPLPLLATATSYWNMFHRDPRPEKPTTALSPVTAAADSSRGTMSDSMAVPIPVPVPVSISGRSDTAVARANTPAVPGAFSLPASPSGSLRLSCSDADAAPMSRDRACSQQQNLPPSPLPSPSLSPSPSTRRMRKSRRLSVWLASGNGSGSPSGNNGLKADTSTAAETDHTVVTRSSHTHMHMQAQTHSQISEVRAVGWSPWA
ncbi:hypothetical protein BROUX41_001800 [Berkeleyomyces rouxiae]|uniref:uncharacterized protein n=1 Tax=Berkeleyomyces rouxiae TaxID=2035830 RepID=UPI003B77FB88